MVVYEIRCLPTGKVYIGSTKDHQRRWYTHYHQLVHGKHHSPRLQAAWDKHGAAAFATTVLACAIDPESLVQLEQAILDQTGAADQHKGFNCAHIADRPALTEEIRLRMCASQQRRGPRIPHSEETRRKMSRSAMGKKKSETHRMNNRLARLGKPTKVTEPMRLQIMELKKTGISARAIGRAVGICHHTVKSALKEAA